MSVSAKSGKKTLRYIVKYETHRVSLDLRARQSLTHLPRTYYGSSMHTASSNF